MGNARFGGSDRTDLGPGSDTLGSAALGLLLSLPHPPFLHPGQRVTAPALPD